MRELEKIEKKQKVRKDSGPDCREEASAREICRAKSGSTADTFVCGVLFLSPVFRLGQLTVTVRG